MASTRKRRMFLALATVVAAGSGTVTAVAAQAASAGCRVDYAVTNQWQGGFGASVTVTNLGDAVNGWTLTWSYTAGQAVTQAWNATVTQSGAAVTARDAGYNGSLATGATASFGFNASWNNASNPTPASFALNGVTCTGAVSATPTPTRTSPTPTPTRTSPTPTPTSTTPVPPQATPTTPPAAYPNPGVVTGDTGVHDPSVVKTPSGGYILVHTGANISIKTSTDRTAWHNAGSAFPSGASWTLSYTGGSNQLWAPDISYHNGKYYMYYAASSFGSQNSAIFLATSSTGASGSWTNQGLIISTSSSNNYNAIDPNLVVDDQGRWWLDFGSFWTGIKMIPLDPATGKRSGTSVTSLAQRTGGTTAIEAPYIFKHGSYYYLWVSFDLCCQGASSTYRIMVGRSTSVTGPYADRNGTAMTAGGGTQILAGHGSIHGPGHEAVFADTDANVLVYHYYANSGASYLGINLLGYDSSGWPFVY
ncbi:family 43 glycosylhydrolase [Rugosimonospora africana]|nr:family 43 glycosylhydrolase [Rugosimonospora africana]